MNPDGSYTPPVHGYSQPAPSVARLAGVPALEVGMATDPGRDPNKQTNEDAMTARDTPHGFLAVVCDGMGGHVGGKEASHLAIDTIFRVFDATPNNGAPQQILRDALTQANGAVYARGLQSPELKGMGSTCVAILVHPHGTDVAHVGDSRVYLMTQGQVYQVTKDHSLVQRLIDANMLTPEQAANHPNANQITNAFGQRPDIDVEIRPQAFPHGQGDVFVLCSDGLSDEVGPQDIVQILAPLSPVDQSSGQLIDLANARGGHDNITVVLVRFPGGAPFAAAPSVGPSSTRTATLGPTSVAPVAGVPTTTAEMEILAPAAIAAAAPQFAQPAPQFAPPAPYQPTPADMPVQKKKTGSIFIVIGVIVLLGVVGAAVALLFLKRGDGKVEAAPSSSIDDDDVVPEHSAKSGKPKPLPAPELPPPSASPSGSQGHKPVPAPTSKNVPLPENTIKSPSGESTVKE